MSVENFEVRGMQAYVHPMGNDAGMAHVSVRVGTGSIHESLDATQIGAMHGIEHVTHLRPGEFGTQEALDAFDGRNGMSTNADTYYQRLRYYATGADPETLMYRLSQVVCHARFNEDPEGVAREIEAIRREAHTSRDDIGRLDSVAGVYALFGAPYGRRVLGHADHIDFSPETLWSLYQRTHHLGNMSLIAVGSVKSEEIREYIERYFPDRPSYPNLEPQPLVEGRYAGQTTGLLREQSSNARVSVLTPLGELTPLYHQDPQLYRVAIAAISTKLFATLRYDMGAAYSAYLTAADFNTPRAWHIEAHTTTEPNQKAIDTALGAIAQILELAPKAYDDDALLSARGQRAGHLRRSMDGVESRAETFAYHLDEERVPHSLIPESRRVQTLSLEAIRQAMAQVLDHVRSQPSVTHITGPAEAVSRVDNLIDIQAIA